MPVEIHGKQYVTVNERVQEFHELYPNGAIHCHLEENCPENMWIMHAVVCPDVENTERHFSGIACEVIGSSQINRTSALENCETSAIGRALGFLGLGVVDSIATADEVQNAIHQQNNEFPVKAGIKVKSKEQNAMFESYLEHHYFETENADGVLLRDVSIRWWDSLTTEPQAEKGLVSLLQRMTKFDEKIDKKLAKEKK